MLAIHHGGNENPPRKISNLGWGHCGSNVVVSQGTIGCFSSAWRKNRWAAPHGFLREESEIANDWPCPDQIRASINPLKISLEDGCAGTGERKRRRSSNGYARA
jgi:hypothetical protein